MKYFVMTIFLVLIIVLVWLVFFSGLMLKKKTEPAATSSKPQDDISPVAKLQEPRIIILETNYGSIKIQTDPKSAPETSANFVKLVEEGFYNELTFHRIIPGFVIQGGDPNGDGRGGPAYTLPAEIKLLHSRGAVAMARLPDQVNPERRSSGSQFYIALADLPALDGQYTVFGEVAAGMEVVAKIASIQTDANDKPLEPVIIKKAYIE